MKCPVCHKPTKLLKVEYGQHPGGWGLSEPRYHTNLESICNCGAFVVVRHHDVSSEVVVGLDRRFRSRTWSDEPLTGVVGAEKKLAEKLALSEASRAELMARNERLHREVHALRMRLNYPLATSDEETLKEIAQR